MKIKTLNYFLGLVVASSMLVSCSSSPKTASSFGERKYAKGNFYNNPGSIPTTVASNGISTEPKVAAVSKTVVTERTQSNTPNNSTVTSATVIASNVPSQQVMPARVAAKKNLGSMFAEAKTKAVAKAYAPTTVNRTENVNSIETTAQVQRGGGGFDFSEHPVGYILVGLLIIIIVGLLIIAAANGDLQASASAS